LRKGGIAVIYAVLVVLFVILIAGLFAVRRRSAS
jgi:hypothetical protein